MAQVQRPDGEVRCCDVGWFQRLSKPAARRAYRLWAAGAGFALPATSTPPTPRSRHVAAAKRHGAGKISISLHWGRWGVSNEGHFLTLGDAFRGSPSHDRSKSQGGYMFNVLIDTCVWLDLAQDPKQTPLVLVVENMVKDKMLSLIVPRLVYVEFQRNRARVAKASARSLATHFQQVKAAVNKGTTNAKRKKALLAQLDDLNHKIPIIGGAAQSVLERIDKLLGESTIIETSDAAKLRAADRSLNRIAPCHHENKNSMADATLIEIYFEIVKAGRPGERFAFVTHNKDDFSLPNGNQKLPHPDLAAQFSRIKSMYFINLAELLRRIDPSTLSELTWEQTWQQEPRGLSELLKAEDLLFHQVWYNRHWNLRYSIERGKHKLVTREEWERKKANGQNQTIDTVWVGALRAAKRVEKEYGKGNLGPWTAFEWGMINGKLSAIRWMLGDEWDMLDT